MASYVKSEMKLVYLMIILLTICVVIYARPGGEWPERIVNGCDEGDTRLIEICQRCAKQTKSTLVYPMCCNNEDEVHNWCIRYTNFGKGKEV